MYKWVLNLINKVCDVKMRWLKCCEEIYLNIDLNFKIYVICLKMLSYVICDVKVEE